MDISNLLADGRDSKVKSAVPPSPRADLGSKLGILSRTVFTSPVVNLILPAKLRDEWTNDIIFVGERHVELKEMLEDGHLRHIATKSDFDARIRSASVLASTESSRQIFEDAMEVEYGGQDKSRILPPQIVVLVLDTAELVLLIARQDINKSVFFETCSRPVPTRKSPLEDPGRHVAVDPRSRAIAVAASATVIMLYNVASSEDHTLTLHNMINKEFAVKVEMTVLKMDFVHPPTTDDTRIYLVVIGTRGENVLRLTIKSWDHSSQSWPPDIHSKEQNLGKEHGMPTMLIPLTEKHPGSFMLVCERAFSVYQNIHLGSPQQTFFRGHSSDGEDPYEAPRVPGASARLPRWVSWARPWRGGWWKDKDDLYLAREDGVVRHVSVASVNGRLGIQKQGLAGKLDNDVDTAFACVELTGKGKLGSGPDGILVGSSLSDGGVYQVNKSLGLGYPRMSRAEIMTPRKTENLHNWAPFTEICVINGVETNNALDLQHVSLKGVSKNPAQKLFATSGKGRGGAVTELRYGLEATIESAVPLGRSVVNGMWPLHQSQIQQDTEGTDPEHANCILFSYPTHSSVFLFTFDSLTELEWMCDNATIAVSVLNTGGMNVAPAGLDIQPLGSQVAVQVTASSIKLLHLTLDEPFVQNGRSWDINGILCAAVETVNNLVLVAARDGARSILRLWKLVSLDGGVDLKEIGKPSPLGSEATCIAFLYSSVDLHVASLPPHHGLERRGHVQHTTYAAVGTSTGVFHIYEVDNTQGLSEELFHEVPDNSKDGLGPACESVTLLQALNTGGVSSELSTTTTLLCGLRNGLVYAVHLKHATDLNRLIVDNTAIFSLGATPVQVFKDVDKPENAFIYCGTTASYLDNSGGRPDDPCISILWFVDRNDRSFAQSSISAHCQVHSDATESESTSRLVCVSDSKLLIGVLDNVVKPIPRKLAVPGNPIRLLYSSYLRMLIVGSMDTEVDAMKKKRLSLFSIFLVDTNKIADEDAADIARVAYPNVVAEYTSMPGERVCGLTEWFCQGTSSTHHFLVATTISRNEDRDFGSIIYLKVSTNEHGDRNIEVHQRNREPHPVLAISQFQNDSLVYCCGNELRLRRYSAKDRRFHKEVLWKTKSVGVYITTEYPFIFVTTAKHSHIVFLYEDGHVRPFEPENGIRDGIAHLSVPDHQLILTSNKSGTVTGLRRSGHSQLASISACFEANLPCSVTRICKAAFRPPWKRKTIPGIIERDLLGIAADGSLFTFSILNETSWRLLRFVQHMCLRDSRLCYLTLPHAPRRFDRHLEPDCSTIQALHVDGDVLSRLVDRCDARAILDELLDADPAMGDVHGKPTDFDSADRRRSRFEQLVSEALHGLSQNPSDSVEVKRKESGMAYDDPVEAALRYIRLTVEIPF